MKSKKILLEAKPESEEVKDFMKQAEAIGHPFVKRFYTNFNQALKEGEVEIGALRGQTVGDATSMAVGGMQVYATLEIFNAVIRGFHRYMDDSFMRKYVTDSVVFKIPKVEYRELVDSISSGQLPHVEKQIDYATVNLASPESEKGGKVSWTRSFMEDVTFDAQGEMAEGLGHGIAVTILGDVLEEIMDLADNTTVSKQQASGATIALSSPITWAQFLSVVSAVDSGFKVVAVTAAASNNTSVVPGDIGKIVVDDSDTSNPLGVLLGYDISTSAAHIWYVGVPTAVTTVFTADHQLVLAGSITNTGTGTGSIEIASNAALDGTRTYGTADYVLCSPDIYWELVNIIQMTNVLYEGSTDPINKGIIKLALGCTITKQSLLPKGTIIALNSEKAVALVTRRSLKIEPVLFPVWNEYGFIGTVRYGYTLIFPQAIQIGNR